MKILENNLIIEFTKMLDIKYKNCDSLRSSIRDMKKAT